MPKVNIIEDDSLNAFASGLSPKTYTVSLSRGIINKLDDSELEAVIAQTRPEQLIFLGDSFHDDGARERSERRRLVAPEARIAEQAGQQEEGRAMHGAALSRRRQPVHAPRAGGRRPCLPGDS